MQAISALFRDFSYAVRGLRKSQSFAAVAILTLALGVGANTAVFCLVYSAVLRPLPYPQADRLMGLHLTMTNERGTEKLPWSYPKFEDVRALTRSFEALAAYSPAALNLTGSGDPERVEGEFVSATYFPMLGIKPAKGRLFLSAEDNRAEPAAVVLLSDALWRRRYGADPAMVGRSIRLNGVAVEVIGILQPGAKGESRTAEFWAPMALCPRLTEIPWRLTNRRSHWHLVLGKLMPGVSRDQAAAELKSTVRAIEEQKPSNRVGANSEWSAGIEPLADTKSDPGIRKALIVLFGAIGCVLLIACVNLANLLLGRAITRRKEVAIRLSLGATRMSLLRQFLAESLLLSLAGGLAGLLVAAWGIELLRFLQPGAAIGRHVFWSTYLRAIDAGSLKIEFPVVAFNVVLSLLAGVLFGLWPALFASRSDTSHALKDGETPARFRLGRVHPRGILVSAQVALALVLLAGAGLMIRSFWRLLSTDLGVRTDNILTFEVALPIQKYPAPRARAFTRELIARLGSLPGVEGAAISDSLPARGQSNITILQIDGHGQEYETGAHTVSSGFLRLMNAPLIRGRLFTEQDDENGRHVAVISRSGAERLFGGQDPIGHRLAIGLNGFGAKEQPAEIVGVVGDVQYDLVDRLVTTDVYVSSLQSVPNWFSVALRANGDAGVLAASVRMELARLDRELPIYHVKTMDENVSDARSRTRFSTVLLGIFAALALALAAIGVYGVMSYSVAARTREIGVRMALGATRFEVLSAVLRDGALLCVAGVGFGIPAAFASARLLRSLLYEVAPGDMPTFAGVTGVLCLVALLAILIPARRACSIDPVRALRAE